MEEGRPGARRLQQLIAQPGRFLAAIQIGLTTIGFLASAYAAVSLSAGLSRLLAGAGLEQGTGTGSR